MDQETRWQSKFKEVKEFIECEHRNPFKYAPEEMLMAHFLKRCRKLTNAGELKEPRLTLFNELLKLSEKYKRVNQWKIVS